MKSGYDHARILIEKATNDLRLVEIGIEHDAPLDTLAFHLQQTAEKLLKALLASRAIVYPKTHDLELLALLPADQSQFLSFRESLLGWSAFAVEMRYEVAGYPSEEEVRQALEVAQTLRTAVLASIHAGGDNDLDRL